MYPPMPSSATPVARTITTDMRILFGCSFRGEDGGVDDAAEHVERIVMVPPAERKKAAVVSQTSQGAYVARCIPPKL